MSITKETALSAANTDVTRQSKSESFAAKRWFYLIPLIFITYSLAYLDRANYGFAAASGIEQNLNTATAAFQSGSHPFYPLIQTIATNHALDQRPA
ncbi:hypothetical protein BK653_11470 [Pseudomonas brassicacearum]|nr:hypothetical protein BK653_11470 [Pseudomonas brassicacearum]